MSIVGRSLGFGRSFLSYHTVAFLFSSGTRRSMSVSAEHVVAATRTRLGREAAETVCTVSSSQGRGDCACCDA